MDFCDREQYPSPMRLMQVSKKVAVQRLTIFGNGQYNLEV